MLPVFLSELIIVAAPCILGHVRYAFPIIWTMPLALGVLVSLNRGLPVQNEAKDPAMPEKETRETEQEEGNEISLDTEERK